MKFMKNSTKTNNHNIITTLLPCYLVVAVPKEARYNLCICVVDGLDFLHSSRSEAS